VLDSGWNGTLFPNPVPDQPLRVPVNAALKKLFTASFSGRASVRFFERAEACPKRERKITFTVNQKGLVNYTIFRYDYLLIELHYASQL
jgi:hypothetical protein